MSAATPSSAPQRPALWGFALKRSAALTLLERQPAFLHNAALLSALSQSLRYQPVVQRLLKYFAWLLRYGNAIVAARA
ncbi:hypothetical protein C0068_14180 [Zhongshania marina]|uniref:Uncharacterized protein n=1 Tax=Zhongshania marina TaxID=2304603 RepID=A0A2S4HDV1_9GAMM|nr:hypothetical protein C0068_14180 [Marortus luteolus]